MVASQVYSVTRLNQEIKGLLESNPSFANIFVRGEISNYKPHPSGHHYMTIKDAGAAMNAVMFRGDAAKLQFRLQNGMQVVARGRISSFPKTGQVQLYLADMMRDGAGDLHQQFEQLRDKLAKEGLFNAERKRPMPAYPTRIALITSSSGAALQDMLRVLAKRWPVAQVDLFPSLVQGVGAPKELVRALQFANDIGKAELIIIGRGGGSLEDLWAFNSEQVARAIYASAIPVISAVGHEPDVTIADFVADLRAPTPSGAAELAVPDIREVSAGLSKLTQRLRGAQQKLYDQRAKQVTIFAQRLKAQSPERYLYNRKKVVSSLNERLARAQRSRMDEKELAADYAFERLAHVAKQMMQSRRALLQRRGAALDALSPLKVLGRGYSVATNSSGQVVSSVASLRPQDKLDVRFAEGTAVCLVQDIKKVRN